MITLEELTVGREFMVGITASGCALVGQVGSRYRVSKRIEPIMPTGPTWWFLRIELFHYDGPSPEYQHNPVVLSIHREARYSNNVILRGLFPLNTGRDVRDGQTFRVIKDHLYKEQDFSVGEILKGWKTAISETEWSLVKVDQEASRTGRIRRLVFVDQADWADLPNWLEPLPPGWNRNEKEPTVETAGPSIDEPSIPPSPVIRHWTQSRRGVPAREVVIDTESSIGFDDGEDDFFMPL